MFLNLVENAIKYTQANGKIAISTKTMNNHIQIKIKDTGLGISESDLPYIFDRFYRPKISRSSNGSGLGLSIVKSIILSHGGKISVESTPGIGTSFTLLLPLIV